MYTKPEIRCECGAPMFERPVKDHRDIIALTCTSHSCGEHGVTRYVRMPEVPAHLIVDPKDIDVG